MNAGFKLRLMVDKNTLITRTFGTNVCHTGIFLCFKLVTINHNKGKYQIALKGKMEPQYIFM